MTTGLLEQELDTPISIGEDDLRQYLSEIRRYPLLSVQEERLLAQRCAGGDEEAIRRMVSSNLRLVVSVAREYAGRGVPLLDLIQEGSIGLLAAAVKFDYTLDYRFSTYATKWIRHEISRYLIYHGQLIRVPAHTAERIRKVELARQALIQENGREPSLHQIADRCEIPEAKVRELIHLNPETCSLDAPAGDGEDGTLGLMLEDVRIPQPQDAVAQEELNRTMGHLLGMLNERQRQVLRLRFGMEDGRCYSLEQIGSFLGISKERVRQIEKQAMDKLQKLGERVGLEDFL